MSLRNCIIVSNLPLDVTNEKLTIYFQRNKNGGGDVKNIRFKDKDAIVEFEEEETVDNVVQREHKLNGRLIKVKRYESNEIFVKFEVILSPHAVEALGYQEIQNFSQHLANLDLERKNGKLVVCGNFDELKMLEKKLIKSLKQTSGTEQAKSKLRDSARESYNDGGARRKSASRSIPSQDLSPTPRSPGSSPGPENGRTYRYVSKDSPENLIKRMFSFPAGQVRIQGRYASYPPYKRIVILPESDQGNMIDAMFAEAFNLQKLFYIERDQNGSGFCIRSSYNIFESHSENYEVYLKGHLSIIRQRLRDLHISLPVIKKKESQEGASPSKPATYAEKNQETKFMSQIGPFPQPEGVVMNSEYHEDDLTGFPAGSGSIHLYFRCSGGVIQTDLGERIHYPAYNRTACLPGTIEGRKLWVMLRNACEKRKLFVVDKTKDEFLFKTKLELLWSNQYPQAGYLDSLYAGLLKLNIHEPLGTPELPSKAKAHYESNSDEEEEKKTEIKIKKGPHPQPEEGKMRIEKDVGTINMCFQFSGGKMNIKGAKPSKSYDIQYSQLYNSAKLPDTNEGRKVLWMIREAFDQRELFYVGKRVGEPSFRIRSHVGLLLKENPSLASDLPKLLADLKRLGISEPTSNELKSLMIPKARVPPSQNQQLTSAFNVTPTLLQRRQLSERRIEKRADSKHNLERSVVPGKASRLSPPVYKEAAKKEVEKCSICLDVLSRGRTKTLPCKHSFHEKCVDEAIKRNNKCPYCKHPLGGNNQSNAGATGGFLVGPSPFSAGAAFGANFPLQNTIGRFGNQPENGTMTHMTEHQSLPGYENCGTIVIRYNIPGGIQGPTHQNPGVPYPSTFREAYLPDTNKGRELLQMLKRAFDAGLTFTVGRSQSSDDDNQIIWNGIQHKTNRHGGVQSYGYPDIDYLDALRRELNSMGIM